MKTKLMYSLLLAGTLSFVACSNNNERTEPSENMGAQNAEGGTSPNVSSRQDSLAKTRGGGADQNSGISEPMNGNGTSSGTSTTGQ